MASSISSISWNGSFSWLGWWIDDIPHPRKSHPNALGLGNWGLSVLFWLSCILRTSPPPPLNLSFRWNSVTSHCMWIGGYVKPQVSNMDGMENLLRTPDLCWVCILSVCTVECCLFFSVQFHLVPLTFLESLCPGHSYLKMLVIASPSIINKTAINVPFWICVEFHFSNSVHCLQKYLN
jgi:hypothetical protein